MKNFFLHDGYEDRIIMLINDLVIKREYCNFNCDYCLSSEKPVWMKERFSEKLTYTNENGLGKRLQKLLDNYHKFFLTPILRISGGELFMIKNVEDFILRSGKQYETIQIITNGSLINNKILSGISSLSNCCFQVSLDGNLEMNYYRIKNDSLQNHVLKNIELILDYGFSVEIASVLTDINTGNYFKFVEYMYEMFGDKVKLYPFPVRGELKKKFFPSEDQVNMFIENSNHVEAYKEILPPEAYMKYLNKCLRNGQRENLCVIPACSIQIFDDGSLTPCPNAWSKETTNLLLCQDIKKELYNEKLYKLFLQKKPRLKCCKDCYTSYEVINLFLTDKITPEEMWKNPLYRGEQTKKILLRMKNEMGNRYR